MLEVWGALAWLTLLYITCCSGRFGVEQAESVVCFESEESKGEEDHHPPAQLSKLVSPIKEKLIDPT